MSISRRKFLGWIGAAGLSTALSNTAGAVSSKDFKGYPDSVGVLYDSGLCIGCRRCEEGCNTVNNLPPPERPFKDLSVLDEKRRTTPKAYTVVNRYDSSKEPLYRKIQCNHCLEPACASVCFVRAYTKTKEGAVIYDESVCVGCRFCIIACPFEIPTYEYDKALTPRIMKCTLCYPRIIKGLLPGCVASCPTEALSFGKRTDLIRIARERIRRYPDRYVDHIYGEHEVGGTNWLYLSEVPYKELGMREDLGVTPAPELSAGALEAVAKMIGLGPVLLTGVYAVTKRSERVAALDKKSAVAVALEKAGEEAQQKFSEALAKAEKDKERAIDKAVKAGVEESGRTKTREDSSMPQDSTAAGETWATPLNVIAGIIIVVGLILTVIRFTGGLGAVTNLSDDNPWGIWVGFDLLVGVALAAGGYVTSAAVYIFGMKRYHSAVRPAILTGFIGYSHELFVFIYDVGRPWRMPYPFIVQPGTTSLLLVVAACTGLYLTVLFIEFSPAALEWLGLKRARNFVVRLTVLLTICGVVISTVHQSTLGALFLIAPSKLHPLWYSPYLPIYFFITSIIAGLSMVIFESTLVYRYFKHKMDAAYLKEKNDVALGFGKAAAFVLAGYFVIKVFGISAGNNWHYLGTGYGIWYLVELLGFVALPAFLYAVGVREKNLNLIKWTSALTVLGIIVNRLNVSLIAFNWQLPSSERYFPHWMEIAISIFIFTLGLLAFRFIVTRMPVLYEHPDYRESH